MRVAIVSAVFPPYKGGIGSVAAQDARLLRARQVDVAVFSPLYQAEKPEDGVVRLKPLFSFGNAAFTPSLFWKLREADIIHLHYPAYGMDMFAVLASWVFRKPLFVTYHMKTRANDWRNAIFALHRLIIEPFILASANIVSVSTLDYAASAHLRHRKLIELPFGVDVRRFTPEKNTELRKVLKFEDDTLALIFVGGLDKAHYFKGLDVLLRAISLATRTPKIRLLVVGEGEERKRFEELAVTLGIGDNVLFLGSVSHEDLPKIYRAADLHVLPSLDRGEAYGLVTLEAGASGLASFVSNLPGMRMLVDPHVTGERLVPSDARALAKMIDAAVEDPERCRKMGEAARERVARSYDEEKVADKLLLAYKSLIV
jgi:glycosyltransferase involved in cell wall biosynthesis